MDGNCVPGAVNQTVGSWVDLERMVKALPTMKAHIYIYIYIYNIYIYITQTHIYVCMFCLLLFSH